MATRGIGCRMVSLPSGALTPTNKCMGGSHVYPAETTPPLKKSSFAGTKKEKASVMTTDVIIPSHLSLLTCLYPCGPTYLPLLVCYCSPVTLQSSLNHRPDSGKASACIRRPRGWIWPPGCGWVPVSCRLLAESVFSCDAFVLFRTKDKLLSRADKTLLLLEGNTS
ncbi:hypothetical protein Q8A73_009302 [Channa argus]|nr:hypothetical protein Q8A73_009302 [Channa argus]